MSRVCVIDVAGVSMRLLGRRSGLWMQSLASPPRALAATFPVVDASVQASMTTGAPPGVHGVVAGGIFRRQCRSLGLGERSNTLLSKKRFWHSRHLPFRPKVALVFWSHPLAGAADVVLGASTYGPAAELVASLPMGLYDKVAGEIGPFDAGLVRGPRAGWRASQWIARAAAAIWGHTGPDLMWVHLPGINFEIIRHGRDSEPARAALGELDAIASRLAQAVQASGGQIVVVSNGGYVPVSRPVLPNAALRRAGLLKVRATGAGDVPDLEHSRALVLVDHQVGHVYCDGEAAAEEAAAVLSALPGVESVRPRHELFCEGMGHDRAGERVVLAARDAHLGYAWWGPDQPAPALAAQADVPGKCGYDGCELMPGDKPGVIRYDPSLIRASRGRTDVPADDQCVLGATCELPSPAGPDVTGVAEIVREMLVTHRPVGCSP